MNFADVADDIADALDGIAGLNVYPFAADHVSPPAAVVGFPEDYTFDTTMGRGSDRMSIPVFVLVGKVSDRAARDTLGAYVDGSGAKSIKAKLEGSTYTAFDSLRVQSVEFETISVAGQELLAGVFSVDIYGQGST